MVDIIHVLPERVANQIAAGEVIQRPASAVKELMENAVDAGATRIDLIIKDAGRTLIQVNDNGCGMSKGDLLHCVQRHATSKIHSAEDLFAIRTLGFRGEALASIASVSHLEVKTRQHGEELGHTLNVEGTDVHQVTESAGPQGTSISIKNLFFNVPARRRFLKSNSAEMRHILEEFNRVALVRPDLAFSLQHNGKMILNLAPGKTLHRIIGLFGDQYREKMLNVDLKTDHLKLSGYIGKPEYARKTKGEQYFFANQRYIRHPYLHHAVINAFQELIPDNAHPAYFLFIEVDPASIDVNIHPTKTEIKFQDEKLVYGMLRSAVRETLGKSGSMPSLEFDAERSFQLPYGMMDREPKSPQIKFNPDFNPFEQSRKDLSDKERNNREKWTELFSQPQNHSSDAEYLNQQATRGNPEEESTAAVRMEYEGIFQLLGSYIISTVKSGLLIVHQQRAHERVLFERFMASLKTKKALVQKQLFPINIHLLPNDASLMKDLLEEIRLIGFDIREMGGDTFIVDGIPSDSVDKDIQSVIEGFLQAYKEGTEQSNGQDVNTAAAMARSLCIKPGQILQKEEMHALIDNLFACSAPETSPDGKPSLRIIRGDELMERFKKF